MMEPKHVIESALEGIHERLRSMQRAPGAWGDPESLELTALATLEFRSMIGRPEAFANDPSEVRILWIGFVSRKAGHEYNCLLSQLYTGDEPKLYAAVSELIDEALRRLPLES